MTEKNKKLAPNKKKIIDWNKKSASDTLRISNRLSRRAKLTDKALRRLHQKIREVYEEDDDNTLPEFFNINLFNEEEEEEEKTENTRRQTEIETIRTTKEQQLAGKLNTILSTTLTAKEANLSPRFDQLEYTSDKCHRKQYSPNSPSDIKTKNFQTTTFKRRTERKKRPDAMKGQKKAQSRLPESSLNDYLTPNADELNSENSETNLAKLLLKKSGRRTTNKKLSDLVQKSSTASEKRTSQQNDNENT